MEMYVVVVVVRGVMSLWLEELGGRGQQQRRRVGDLAGVAT